MVTISNIDETIARLDKLAIDAIPQWGGMTPQQMVEHLATTIKISNGKLPIQQRTTIEEGNAIKAQIVYTDMEFPMGLKSPTIPDGPPVYDHQNLSTAIIALRLELTDFSLHHKENPEITHVHPRLGALNHAEWLTLHGKHFKHHFKQFDIL